MNIRTLTIRVTGSISLVLKVQFAHSIAMIVAAMFSLAVSWASLGQEAATRPPEELYDLQADPYEVHNLASSPRHGETLQELRALLQEWIAETKDQGAILEAPKTIEKWDKAMQERHP